MAENGCNNSVTSSIRPDFPPGLASKMLEIKKSLDELQSSLSPIIQKPHHEAFAKVSYSCLLHTDVIILICVALLIVT